MPERPKSQAQLGYIHAAANRGEDWAEKTVHEWHGKKFGHLPKRKSAVGRVAERLKGRG